MMLQDKIAVITGAGSAWAVHRQSGLPRKVRRSSAPTSTRSELANRPDRSRKAGGVAVPVRCDVSREEDVASLVATTVERFGRLDVMFNNVGVPTRGSACRSKTTPLRMPSGS